MGIWFNQITDYLNANATLNQAAATQQKAQQKPTDMGALAKQQQSILQKQSTALQSWQSMASSGTITNALGQNLQNSTSSKQMDITLKQAQSIKKFFS